MQAARDASLMGLKLWGVLLLCGFFLPGVSSAQPQGTGPTQNINRVFFRGTPQEVADLRRIIQAADLLPAQVLLELYLLDVIVVRNDNAGMDLEFFFGPERPFTGVPLGGYSSNQTLQNASQTIRYGSLSTEKYRLFFNFLKNRTKTKILARPALMVLNGQTAQVNLGGTRRFVTGSAVAQSQFGGQSASLQTQDVPVGQNVAVTPRILPNEIVMLGLSFLDQQVSGVDTFASSVGNIQLPQTAARAFRTSLMVKNGEGVVIGGLRTANKAQSESQLPLLGFLPFIGKNFGNTTDLDDSRELIVVLKVSIIRSPDLGPGNGIVPAPTGDPDIERLSTGG